MIHVRPLHAMSKECLESSSGSPSDHSSDSAGLRAEVEELKVRLNELNDITMQLQTTVAALLSNARIESSDSSG